MTYDIILLPSAPCPPERARHVVACELSAHGKRDVRRSSRVVMDGVFGNHPVRIPVVVAAGVEITVENRKVTRCHLQSNAATGLKLDGGVP